MSDITANIVVSMPSQLFTLARSFKANANGKIYIGLIDTDPVDPANQIPVYIENEDGSYVQVSQPIVINAGGYPVYNGQISKFVTVKGHSMAVYDQYGVQQFYYPNVLSYDPDQFSQRYQYSVFWTTPQEFGADDTGVSSVNTALTNMFASQYSSFVFPRGTYLLDNTLTTTVTKNISIFLEAGAVIKLANNVRKNMLVFVGNGTNTFEWSGGEIDGNWEGQGAETMTGGNVDDVSHGLVMSKFGTAHVHDLYIHDCMGHHINHGGNKNFIAERINIRAHVSTLKPLGGARGDGITGCSENVTIRDIRGFSTDDLIAVVSGIDWIAGWYPNRMSVKSVLIENIRCETYNYQGVDNYSWNGVSVGNSLGYSTDSVTIRNVSGDTQTRGILVSQEAYGTDYYGDIRKVNVNKIALCVHGNPTDSFTGKMNTQHITIGRAGMNEASTSRNYTIYELQISDVQCKASDNSLVAISIGHTQVRAASISNVQCTYDTATQAMRAIIIVGQKDIPSLTIDNIQQQGTGASPDSVRSQRCAIESYYGATGAMTLTATRLTKLLNVAGIAYIPNTSFVQATGQTKVIPLLYGKDMVCNLDANGTGGVSAIPLADGVNLSTPGLGHISYSKIRDAWTFHEFAVQWDTVSYGMPTAANFPNYALFSWKIGTVIPVKGSPYGERKAYLCIGGTPTFSPNDAVTWSSSTALRSSVTSPVSFSPGCVVWAYLPAQTSDSGWAYQSVGMVQYLITDNSNRNGSKRIQYDSSGASAQRVQVWNGSSWSTWQNLSV